MIQILNRIKIKPFCSHIFVSLDFSVERVTIKRRRMIGSITTGRTTIGSITTGRRSTGSITTGRRSTGSITTGSWRRVIQLDLHYLFVV